MKYRTREANGMTHVEVQCPWCKGTTLFEVPTEQWKLYLQADRPHVQECFPQLDANKREALISGTCSSCWDDMFKEDL